MTPADLSAIVMSFKDWAVWVIIAIVAVFGALGGWAHKLVSPARDQRRWASFVIVGAIAALAVLFAFGPKDPIRLIALAVVAGYGGKSILDALENRVKLALSQAENEKLKEHGIKVVAVARDAAAMCQKFSETHKATEGWRELDARLDVLEAYFKK
jgi:hypothetical protein